MSVAVQNDRTALHWASASGKTNIVTALLKNGANLEATTKVLCVRPPYRRERGRERVCVCTCGVALHCAVLVRRTVTHADPHEHMHTLHPNKHMLGCPCVCVVCVCVVCVCVVCVCGSTKSC